MAKTFWARVNSVEPGTVTPHAIFVASMRKYVDGIYKFRRTCKGECELVGDTQWCWDIQWVSRVPSERRKPKKPKKVKLLNLGLNLWEM